MRRRRDIGFVVGVLVAGIVAVVVLGGGMASGASTANSTVAVTVASATTLNAAGCASGTANVTDFGTVFPATSNVTSADCAVVFGSSNDTSMLRAYQSDQAGTALNGLSNGALDTTFDGDGKQLTAIGAGDDYGSAVAIQADGKIVVAGRANMGTEDFAVVRYNTNGSLDTSFDTDGMVTTPISGSAERAMAVAVQGDGKIVAAGYAFNGGFYDFAVVRYNSDGSLDTTFDTDGKQTTLIGATWAYGYGVAIQPDGKIVVAGKAYNGANDDFAAARYNTNGSLDTSFDTDGKVTTAVMASVDEANAVAIQSDGKIVLAGVAWGANNDFAAVRYNTNGSLDTGFDTDGKLTTPILAGNDIARAITIQPDGKIILAGEAYNGSNFDVGVVRYGSDGTLDASFDTDGKLTTTFGTGSDYANGVAVQADGKVVVAGYALNGGTFNDFALARYGTDGSLDASFDTDGKVLTDQGISNNQAWGIAMQLDGKIVVGGWTYNVTNVDVAALRYGGGGSVADWAGSWGAANLFGACLHTVANASNTWTLAGVGNCTTAIDANWNALPTTASKIAFAGSGVTNATANLRYGFKATASQQAGTYVAPLTFEVVAPNA